MELGRIMQYHGVVRMRYGPTDVQDEGQRIQTYLDEALALFDESASRFEHDGNHRDELGAHGAKCDVLNSIGMQKQKQKLFGEASRYFRKHLDVRLSKLSSDHAGLGQAYVSLGSNLLHDQPPHEEDAARAKEALPLLTEAKRHYHLEFHERHPKLVHAHKGLSHCYLKLRRPKEAREHLHQARAICEASSVPNQKQLAELEGLEALIDESEGLKPANPAASRLLRRANSSDGRGSSSNLRSLLKRASTASMVVGAFGSKATASFSSRKGSGKFTAESLGPASSSSSSTASIADEDVEVEVEVAATSKGAASTTAPAPKPKPKASSFKGMKTVTILEMSQGSTEPIV